MIKTSNDIFPVNPKIIFMGTPEFASSTLKTLVDKRKNILAVVTQPDRPKGRGRKFLEQWMDDGDIRYVPEIKSI